MHDLYWDNNEINNEIDNTLNFNKVIDLIKEENTQLLSQLKTILYELFTPEVFTKIFIQRLHRLGDAYNTQNMKNCILYANLDNILSEFIAFTDIHDANIELYKFFKQTYNIEFNDFNLIKNLCNEKLINNNIRNLIINILQSYIDQKLIVYDNPYKEHDPYEFYLLKDNINDIQYSSRSPEDFSIDRTTPIIVINDDVETNEEFTDINDIDIHHIHLIDKYKKKKKLNNDIHFTTYNTDDDNILSDGIEDVAAGSAFNKTVLLEFIQGNTEKIKQALLNHGYKKVYINTNSIKTNRKYKRIAKFIKRKENKMDNWNNELNKLKNKINKDKDKIAHLDKSNINKYLEYLLNNDSNFINKLTQLIKALFPREVFQKFIKDEYIPFLTEEKDELCSKAFIDYIYNVDIYDFVTSFNKDAESLISNFVEEISQQYNIIEVNTIINALFGSYNNIYLFIQKQVIELYNQYDAQKGFFRKIAEREYDPYEFYLIKDKIGDLQYSSRTPYTFSEDRTSPIIVINDHVELAEDDADHHLQLIEHYKEKYKDNNKIFFNTRTDDDITDLPDNITETAAGSVFNRTVLLEYAQGDINKIKQVLLNHGYKKIYINNNNNETSQEYKRIAKIIKKNRIIMN